jgi:hypothetical protein
MSDDTTTTPPGGVWLGKRAAQLPPEPPGPDWPFPTCVRFCAVPHELGEPCRSFGDEVYLTTRSIDPETGEPTYVLVFPTRDDEPDIVLSAFQASVLVAEMSPEIMR